MRNIKNIDYFYIIYVIETELVNNKRLYIIMKQICKNNPSYKIIQWIVVGSYQFQLLTNNLFY